jgi:predicted Zn-dependent protease
VPDSQSLEAYLASGIIESATTTDVRGLTINGLPAATGVAKGQDWTFRLFAVRMGGNVYRLNMAARELSPEVDAAFWRAAESFRRLEPAEVAALRPLRIALVVAGPGDSEETLARRMRLDEPRVERFRVLNGLGEGERVLPGQRYKIVVD